MDMKSLLEKMMKFAGEPEQKAGDQVRGTEKTKKSGKDHPFKGRLVGDSVEPQANMLEELSQEAQDKTIEWKLAEEFAKFLEDNIGVEPKRPPRKGSRPQRDMGKTGEPSKRYNQVKESQGDGDVANTVVAEVIKLIGEGHTEVSPDVITTKISAALGRPFMLKDLVATNNASPELQHYIDSINPTKIKFSTDILTVKNQDPMKEKQTAQDGVAKMAARASSRPRLGESTESVKYGVYKRGGSIGERKGLIKTFDTKEEAQEYAKRQRKHLSPGERKYYKLGYTVKAVKPGEQVDESQGISKGAETKFHSKLDALVHDTFGKRKDEVEESAEELNVGDDVIITGPVEHKGATGVIDSFGQDKRFVVVNLYNHGKKSFHSSDVSYNDYADSDEEDYEDEDQGFFVAISSEEDGVFIGMVVKEDGKWRERTYKGKAPYNWGGTYMGYLTPQDVMTWINKDYGRSYEVKGPLDEDEANEYLDYMSEGIVDKVRGANYKRLAKRSFDKAYDAHQDSIDAPKTPAERRSARAEFNKQYDKGVAREKLAKELGEGWGAEPAAERHNEQMAAVARVLQKYQSDPEQAKLASYMFQNNWNAQAIEKEMSGQGRYDLEWWKGRLAKAEQEYGPQKDWTQMMVDKYLNESGDTPLQDREDYQAKRKALQDIQMDPGTKHDPELKAELAQRLARLNQQYSELKEMVNRVKESRGHKIIARKLADIERKPSAPSADDDVRKTAQAKADYAKYVAKMRKKDPNYVPLYKMDENVPTAQTTMADKTGANDPQQAAKVAQATQALKSATGATAPTPNIAKALDAATQGKSVGATDMKAIEPMIDVLGAAAQDPKLANQFKTLAAQAKQVK